ncbi:MAG: hypothetical protein K8R88_11075 [Armatimonadetes bacterium]|nr:hypothetical protein [Armatimonadota bacterium]
MLKKALLFALLCTSSASFAGTYDFARKVKVGDTFTYNQTLKYKEEDSEIEMLQKSTMKYIKVNDDGSVVIAQEDTPTSMTAGGEKIDLGEEGVPSTKSEMTILKNGVTDGIKEEEADNPVAYRLANLTGFIRPKNQAETGDVWEFEFKADEKKHSVAAKAKYKVGEEEDVAGFKCVKVTFEVAETEGKNPGKVKGAYWIRISDGVEVKMVADAEKLPIDEEDSIDAHLTLEIVH